MVTHDLHQSLACKDNDVSVVVSAILQLVFCSLSLLLFNSLLHTTLLLLLSTLRSSSITPSLCLCVILYLLSLDVCL